MSAGTANGNWHDLSDDELQARLTQRGVGLIGARELVLNRERKGGAQVITEYLNR